MDVHVREKMANLRVKTDDMALRIAEQAVTTKDVLKRKYDISAKKAKVLRLEHSLKKDFEKAGRAMYHQ